MNGKTTGKPAAYTYTDIDGNPLFTMVKVNPAKFCPQCGSDNVKDKGSFSKCYNCGEYIQDSEEIQHAGSG